MSLSLKQVRCENTSNPLGIGTKCPEFSWQLESDKTRAAQSAYQITVSDERGEMLYDSGKVISDKQYGIQIDLSHAIKSFQKYFYEIMVWDENNEITAPYRAWFLTGVFKAVEWKADWFKLWEGFGLVRYTRREFTLFDEPIKDAYCFIGAVGEKANSVVAYINGKRVGGEPLFPGATEYFRAFYTTVDVKELLLPDRNTVGMLISKCASLILKITYEGGKEQYIVTDRNDWKMTYKGGYSLGHLNSPMYHGKSEKFNRQKHFVGFAENGFDDSAWGEYTIPYGLIDFAPLFISPQYCKTTTEEPIHPRSIEYFDDRILVDFGVNMSGFVTFHFRGKQGQTVKICYSERVKEDRHVELPDSYSFCEYTFASDDTEYYRPEFVTTGFCAVELYGYDGELHPEDISAYFVHSDIVTKTAFASSNTSLNKLEAAARRSFLSNLINYPTDCPERERRGWTADAYAVCEAECVEFDMVNLYRQWFVSYKDCQRQCGWIPVELPLSTDEQVDLNWPMSSILIPYQLLKHYGDLNFCKTNYPIMKQYAELLIESSDDNYTLSPAFYSFKDWLAEEKCTPTFLGMAYFFRAMRCISEIADVIGIRDDADRYKGIAENIRIVINDRYYKEGNYDNGTQSANAHALHFGICDEHNREAVTQSLVENIERKNKNTTGFMGTSCILQALSQNHRSDAAYRLLKNPNQGGWLWLIETFGATTFPENYRGDSVSQNHAFLGSAPGLWLYKYLCGISPLAYGYRKIGINPYFPEDLSTICATISTPYGEVSVKLTRAETITAEIRVPVGTTAVFTYGEKKIELVSGAHTLCDL